MDRVICLVGKSGTGKTTIAKELEQEGYNIIDSYTTRQPREPQEWGHTFITNAAIQYRPDNQGIHKIVWQEGNQTKSSSNIIAMREIYGEIYFATKEQYEGKGTSIYTVCPQGANQVKKNVIDAQVITIYLTADERTRAIRLQERYWRNYNGSQDYEQEVMERLEKDKRIFATCSCDYTVDTNGTLEETIEHIKQILKQEEEEWI